MSASDLLVTFSTSGKSLVFQAVADVENTKSYELTTEPGVVERVGSRFPRRFAMMVEVSNDIQDLPAIGSSGEDLTKGRDARQQYRELEALAGTNVTIDARAVADPTAVYTVEAVRAIDSLKFETGFKVQVTCTEDLSGKLTGGGLSSLRLGTIRIPMKPTRLAGDVSPLGAGDNTCTTQVPVKRREAAGWLKAVGGFLDNTVGAALRGIGNVVKSGASAVARGFQLGVDGIVAGAKATGNFVANLFTAEVDDFVTKQGTLVDGKCVVGDGGA